MQNNKIELITQVSNADNTELRNIAIKQLDSIIQRMPECISQLINQAFIHKRIPKEYLLSSILFAFSNAAGLAFKINCMNYTNYANLFFAIIGSRGDLKSPAMDIACSLLNKKDTDNYLEYQKQLKELNRNEFHEKNADTIRRKQYLIQNSTIEAAMFRHLQNPYSIGIYVDELTYLIDKMANKNSNEGSMWRVFFLQGNTNKHVDVSRKTTDSYRLEKSYPTLLGSIQNQFVKKLFADGNLESGFIDRLLFTVKLTENKNISKKQIAIGNITNYENLLDNLIKYREHIQDAQKEYTVLLGNEADEKVHHYSQDLLNKQNELYDHTSEYISKMLITIHKLVLLIHLIKNSFDSSYQSKIDIETVELAILINDFYFNNFKLVLNFQDEKRLSKNDLQSEVAKLAIKNGASNKAVASILGVQAPRASKILSKFRK